MKLRKTIASLTLTSLLIGTAVLASPAAMVLYHSLRGRELSVEQRDAKTGSPIVGVAITQIKTARQLCRKTGAVVPNPEYEYSCYEIVSREINSKLKFIAMEGQLLRIIYRDIKTGAPLVGITVFEKSDDQFICQKTGPVVPNPFWEYTCYRKMNI
jgi:hypothetical protein